MLISTRSNRIIDPAIYYEKHHIIPKSIGGTNDISNLVYLTAREHFIAHWLLFKIYETSSNIKHARSITQAFYYMSNLSNYKKLNTSSIAYSEAREAYIQCIKDFPARSKPVIQYSKTGEVINIWKSAAFAQRSLKIYHVSACCRGSRNESGGFIWKYINSQIHKNLIYAKRKTNNIKNKIEVYQLTKDGSSMINKFSSISQAVRFTGIPKSSIQGCLAGTLLHAGNYKWKNNKIN